MMSCAAARELLSEVAAGERSGGRAAEALEHAHGCGECARFLDETRATVALLRGLGEEPLPADFGASLHLALVAAGQPEPAASWRRAWEWLTGSNAGRWVPLAVGAAALALALAVSLRGGGAGGRAAPVEAAVANGPVAPVFHVPRTKLALVRVDFVAEEQVDGVEFAITLPEGLHFVSDGVQRPEREVRWSAAYAISRSRARDGLRALLALARNADGGVRNLVASALVKSATGDSLGDQAVTSLRALMADRDHLVRAAAVRSLATHGVEQQGAVLGGIADKDPNVRVVAAQSAWQVLDSTGAEWERTVIAAAKPLIGTITPI